jgi:chromosome segregation ATPase
VDIPGDLANAFTRVYGERLKKMEEIAKKYIDKYGLPAVEADINSLLEESKYEREKIIERLNQSLSNLEDRLREGDDLKEGKNQLEETLRGLEREVVTKEAGRAALASKLREFEDDKKDARERYEKVECAWSESIGEIEERRKALDARELELKEAEERQRAALKDTARKAFEDELRNISGLKEELEKKEEELKSERAELEYERREIEERLEKLRSR